MLPPKATKNKQIGYEIEYEIMIIKTQYIRQRRTVIPEIWETNEASLNDCPNLLS